MEKRAVGVIDNGGGVRAISIGGGNVSHWGDVLEGSGDDANGVTEFRIRDEIEASRGRLNPPLGELVV